MIFCQTMPKTKGGATAFTKIAVGRHQLFSTPLDGAFLFGVDFGVIGGVAIIRTNVSVKGDVGVFSRGETDGSGTLRTHNDLDVVGSGVGTRVCCSGTVVGAENL